MRAQARNKKQVEIELPELLTDLPFWRDRYIVLYGGRGGGKSWAVAISLILRAMNEKLLILCAREIQKTIEDSVYKLLVDVINRYGFQQVFQIKKNTIINRHNGSSFIFKGLKHDSAGIRSTEGINICWVEEAHNVTRDSFEDLIPTIRRDDSQLILVFNPKDDKAPVHTDYVLSEREDIRKVFINYYDNPFFPKVLRAEMEYDKKYNLEKYLYVWEGQVKKVSDACIFKERYIVEDFDTHKGVEFFYGADWGFEADPSTLVRCYVVDNELYIDYEVYGHGVGITQLPDFFSAVPGACDSLIRGDSSRPETIAYLNERNMNVRRARKGANSIIDGIEFIKSYKIVHIHERCKHMAAEFRMYKYKVDRLTGEVLYKVIEDKHNHCIDALRYALEELRLGGDVAVGWA